MDTRSMKILAAIVDEYIRTGEPVGSKALAEKPDISVSSATIRNTMAALEQEGYLDHPHTSAGRVPTYKGYRFYIDNLMDPIPLDQADKEQIDGLLEKAVHDSSSSPEEAIVESASAALAEITKCATYSTNHVSQFSVITKVDVIPTGRRMYVLLMITSTGAIKNRVCRMQFDLTNEQMEFFTNFVSKNLQGVNLAEMTDEYINKLTQALGAYMITLSPLLTAVCELSNDLVQGNVDVQGQSNLIECQEFPVMDVMKFLENKKELSALLDSTFSGISIKFGGEFIQAAVTPCCPGRCDFICFCAKDVIVFVTDHNCGGKEFFIEGGCHSDFLQFDESLFDNTCFLVEICLVFHFVRRIAADNHIKVRGKGKVFQYFMHQRPRFAGSDGGDHVSLLQGG